MKNIALWICAAASIFIGLLTITTNAVSALPFFISAIYLAPFIRTKFFPNFLESKLFGTTYTVLVTLILYGVGIALTSGDIDKKDSAKLVATYKNNPDLFVLNSEKYLAQKDYFKAQYELDRLIEALPEEKNLKTLKHKIFISELTTNGENDKLYLFESSFEKYKKLMQSDAKLEEVQPLYEKFSSKLLAKYFQNEDLIPVKSELERVSKFFPSSKLPESFKSKVAALEVVIAKKEEAKRIEEARVAKAKADEEARAERAAKAPQTPPVQSSSSAKSADGTCIVSSILHPHAFECGSQLCALDTNDRTIMIVNGNILPPHAARAHMVKPGYRCTCIRSQTMMAHEKIECNG